VAVVVIDTDIASLLWRNRLPRDIERQLLGQKLLITFVTMDEPLEPFGLTLL
jgi:hypothetical protein